MPVPAIAIHGSGPRGKIAQVVNANFEHAELYDRVETVEFDWDRMVPRPSHTGLRNLYRFLKRNAALMRAVSGLGLQFRANYVDGVLGTWQARLHGLLQWLVPALVAMVALEITAEVLVLAPAAWYGLPTHTPPLRWLVAAIDWTTLGIASGLTALLALAALRLCFTLSPRAVIITFRSILLLLLQPPLIIVIGLFAADGMLLWASIGLLGAAAFVLSGFAALAWCAVVFGSLLVLRARWTRPIRGSLKMMVDGFRYLGEPGYRIRIQKALDKAIRQARQDTGEDAEFVLVGQGLGTVIALDSLTHSGAWRKTHRVLLVTMGSPLRRYVLPFFPRILFPETIEDGVDLIAGRLHKFHWMNIYRPGDAVGGDLGLAAFEGRDISTGQSRRIVGGHADYWLDLDARRAFCRGLREITPVRPLQVPMIDAAHRLPHAPSSSTELRIPASLRPLFRPVLSLAVFAGMLWWVATGLGVLTPRIDATPESLKRGVVVDATATHRRETVKQSFGLTFVHHWQFEFTDPKGTVKHLRFKRDASDAFLDMPHRFDDHALTRQVRAGCEGSARRVSWPGQEMETPCSQQGIRLRYYPGDMTFFDLPDFPRHRFGSDPLRNWTEAGLVAGALTVLTLASLAFGFRVFVLLLG